MNTSDIIQASLGSLGYTFETVLLGNDHKSFTQIHHPDHSGSMIMSTASPLYPFVTASARLICNSKANAYDLATLKGVRIPQSVYVSDAQETLESARSLLERYNNVIVKPEDASMSNGLTLDITDPGQLDAAIVKARQYSEKAIVQEQMFGDEIRFAVVDGVTRAAILRQTARVVGDGVSPLNELLSRENQLRAQIIDTAVPYPALDAQIIQRDVSQFDHIPQKDEIIELSKSTMIKGGASMYNVIDDVDESYLTIANTLGSSLGRGFVVVDMMIQDYTQIATTDNYAFIEFNLTPALQLFYSCRDGRHFRIGERYLAPMMDKIMREGYL